MLLYYCHLCIWSIMLCATMSATVATKHWSLPFFDKFCYKNENARQNHWLNCLQSFSPINSGQVTLVWKLTENKRKVPLTKSLKAHCFFQNIYHTIFLAKFWDKLLASCHWTLKRNDYYDHLKFDLSRFRPFMMMKELALPSVVVKIISHHSESVTLWVMLSSVSAHTNKLSVPFRGFLRPAAYSRGS